MRRERECVCVRTMTHNGKGETQCVCETLEESVECSSVAGKSDTCWCLSLSHSDSLGSRRQVSRAITDPDWALVWQA